jgi:hypothetical protein
MKKARLDQILLRRGAVSEDQIGKALLRQKSRGGKLGTHLLFFRFFTEDQLVQALAEQFGVRGVRLGDFTIPEDVVKKLPAAVAEELLAIPFRFDRESGELAVAIADPETPNALQAIRRASGAQKVALFVAPETVLRSKIAFHYHGRIQQPGVKQAIDLPDLFAGEKEPLSPATKGAERKGSGSHPQPHVLMFTRQLFLKNVLPSVFEREGMRLSFAESTGEVAEFLKGTPCDRMLVSEEVWEEFERFAAARAESGPVPEAARFRTVASSMLENPVSYGRMFDCLLAAVQCAADDRSGGDPGTAPYALMSAEIVEVGAALGLGRIVVDGLRLAAHLLTPGGVGAERVVFGDLQASLRLARRLDFPWDIAACVGELASRNAEEGKEPVGTNRELAVTSGVLSLVWYRHMALGSVRGGPRGDLETLRSRLRGQAGILAPSSVVEAYLRILEQTDVSTASGQDIILVGEGDTLSPKLITDLKHHGFRIVECDGLEEARKVYLRRRPAAMMIHVDESLADADRFCRGIRQELKDVETTLFAVTRRNEPSFLLNLMDTWFSDVLTLPMDSQVVVARIAKALSVRDRGAGTPAGQGFGATFRDLSFLDLVQTLGTGGKNVRMRVEHGGGRQADIYFRQGKIVHAASGADAGVDVVYQVIGWQDDGSFRIEPAAAFPPDNVTVPTDYILLEGSRRFDEGRAGR